MNLLSTKLFKYTQGGVVKTLVIPASHEDFAVAPVIQAMGLDRKRQISKLKQYGWVKEYPWGGKPTLMMPTTRCSEWLDGINTQRAKEPELIQHFKTHLPAALGAFLIRTKPETGDTANESLEVGGKRQEIAERLSQPIYIGRELENPDRLRADLTAVGVTDGASVDWLAVKSGFVVVRPDPENSGKTQSITICPEFYQQGKLLELARQGYYPLPEFYRRHPNYYQQKTYTTHDLQEVDGKTVSLGVVRKPLGNAPWYTDEFAERIRLLDKAHEKAAQDTIEKQAKQTVADGSLSRLLWSEEDDDQTGDFKEVAQSHAEAGCGV